MKRLYVYIMASERNGTLYIGVTNNIRRRTKEHKENYNPKSFSKRYHVKKLVYFEAHQFVLAAIKREKQLKKWKREWKIDLIENKNLGWRDLYTDIEDWED